MEKRYQVFISSTFQDLQGARQEVSQALLRADCFPAGMELFPAADEEQFEFIKQVIDQSDYYIVISAGRYGSIHPEKGVSYTELEYDYAVATGKPVIRLLHKDPFKKLRGEDIEPTDNGREKLKSFRQKLTKSSMARFWEDPKELGVEVVYGIMDARKRKAAIGWVRADGRAADEAEIEIAKLQAEVANLKLQLEKNAPKDTLREKLERAVSVVSQAVFPTQEKLTAGAMSRVFLSDILSMPNSYDLLDSLYHIEFEEQIRPHVIAAGEEIIEEVMNALGSGPINGIHRSSEM